MTDVLKKPVHPDLVKTTKIRELQDTGKLARTAVSTSLPKKTAELPKEPPPEQPAPVSKTGLVQFKPLQRFNSVKGAQDTAKKAARKAYLRVVQESAKSPTDAPCDTCKTATCCQAFLVQLSKDEFESGFYEPYAIEVTPEMVEQLRGSKVLRPSILGGPFLQTETTYYYLEGRVGQPCPFLGEDMRCTIYDVRPIVCRSYTCVGDERITEGMRQGTEPILFSDEYAEPYRRERMKNDA